MQEDIRVGEEVVVVANIDYDSCLANTKTISLMKSLREKEGIREDDINRLSEYKIDRLTDKDKLTIDRLTNINRRAIVSTNDVLINHLAGKVEEHGSKHLILINGSSRQDRDTDCLVGARNKNGSCFRGFLDLERDLIMKVKSASVHLDRFSLADIGEKSEKNQDNLYPGTSFDRAINPSTFRGRHATSYLTGSTQDYTKLTIADTHAQRWAGRNPNKHFHHYYYDDMVDILSGLYNFLTVPDHLEVLPKNITLHLVCYAGEKIQYVKDGGEIKQKSTDSIRVDQVYEFEPITGTGEPDPDYYDSMQELMPKILKAFYEGTAKIIKTRGVEERRCDAATYLSQGNNLQSFLQYRKSKEANNFTPIYYPSVDELPKKVPIAVIQYESLSNISQWTSDLLRELALADKVFIDERDNVIARDFELLGDDGKANSSQSNEDFDAIARDFQLVSDDKTNSSQSNDKAKPTDESIFSEIRESVRQREKSEGVGDSVQSNIEAISKKLIRIEKDDDLSRYIGEMSSQNQTPTCMKIIGSEEYLEEWRSSTSSKINMQHCEVNAFGGALDDFIKELKSLQDEIFKQGVFKEQDKMVGDNVNRLKEDLTPEKFIHRNRYNAIADTIEKIIENREYLMRLSGLGSSLSELSRLLEELRGNEHINTQRKTLGSVFNLFASVSASLSMSEDISNKAKTAVRQEIEKSIKKLLKRLPKREKNSLESELDTQRNCVY